MDCFLLGDGYVVGTRGGASALRFVLLGGPVVGSDGVGPKTGGDGSSTADTVVSVVGS